MKILVDDTKLNLLLEQKKRFIGKQVAFDSLVSTLSLLISVVFASYKRVLIFSGAVIKTFFVIVGIIFFIKSIYDIYDSVTNSYSHQDLYKDINKLNEITHNHSIVVIKDTFNEFSNRFLQYYDNRWSCFLFLNFQDNINNMTFITNGISNKLKVRQDAISVEFLTQQIHIKYSESHKDFRCYFHRLFEAKVSYFSDTIKEDTFEIDGIKYRWMTISEMESDTMIMKKNEDVVQFVKSNFS